MRFTLHDPPRVFEVGAKAIRMKDCARIELAPDEQVTFVTEGGGEYDVARKSWGFYATPSLNGRLARFGLRGVLVRGCDGKFYVFLVERGREDEFDTYLAAEGHAIVCWLDGDDALQSLERAVRRA